MAQKRDPVTLPEEAGFALIEVVVSALIVVMVGGAVLALISATTRSAAQQRARSQSYALAQEDLARLRSMRISSLNAFQEVNTKTLGGTEFEVESTGAFVNNTSGTTSCKENESSPDYARITSTVRQKSGKGSPVSLRSIVSPSNGSLDPTHGSLVIAAINSQATALSGLGVSGSGPKSFSATTDSGGCAIFADLPAGTYTVKAAGVGLVEVNGNTYYERQVQIGGKQTSRLQLLFDRPGKLRVPFFYVYEGQEKQTVPRDVSVYDSELGAVPSTFEPTSETVGSTTYSTLPSLYPFKTPYEVYAGMCGAPQAAKGEKATTAEKEEAKKALANVAVPAGGEATAPKVRMPALEVTVKQSGSAKQGATVVLTGKDEACPSTAKYKYTTESKGHQSATTTGAIAPAVPWGAYMICASVKKSGSSYYRTEEEVEVKTFASTVTKTITVPSSGSTGSECS